MNLVHVVARQAQAFILKFSTALTHVLDLCKCIMTVHMFRMHSVVLSRHFRTHQAMVSLDISGATPWGDKELVDYCSRDPFPGQFRNLGQDMSFYLCQGHSHCIPNSCATTRLCSKAMLLHEIGDDGDNFWELFVCRLSTWLLWQVVENMRRGASPGWC